MKIENLTVAVTGGAGFIGSHLVDQLVRAGNRVVVVDNFATGSRANLAHHSGNPRVKIVEADVCHLAGLEKAFSGVDVVFHLATHCVRLSLTDPLTNHDVNATGTLNTLEAAKRNKVKRFIYCSSSEVYGDISSQSGKRVSLTEDFKKLPSTVYGSSKLVGEYYALAYHQTYGLQTMVARPFNAFGPRSYYAGPYGEVIPRFSVLLLGGKQPFIFGSGQQERDFTFVEDTARSLLRIGETDQLLGDTVNISSGTSVSVNTLAKTLCEVLGVPFTPRSLPDRPGDIQLLHAENAKFKALFPDLQMLSFRVGLEKYLSWLQAQPLDFKKLASELSGENWEMAA